MSEQTMQAQIRLVLKEQSDKVLHSLPYCLHLLNIIMYLDIYIIANNAGKTNQTIPEGAV